MHIAWLVWEADDEDPTFWTEEPPSYYTRRIRIVWSPLTDNKPEAP